jgi:predicted 3-demethylubiquinone-9 3-methyltransferase (glyoxalase superfamily)
MRLQTTPRITPFLWFDTQAEEAARFYVSLFEDSKIRAIARYGEGGMGAAGSVMTVDFQLAGQRFVALNGGPTFKFTEAVSFVVNCKDQKEIDRFWAKLGEGGRDIECGWLKDRYGLCWQVVPTALWKMLTDRDPARSARVMHAVLRMKKLDLAALETAYGAARKRGTKRGTKRRTQR